MEAGRRLSGRDGASADVVLNLLAELSTSVMAIREEVARLGLGRPARSHGQARAEDSGNGIRFEDLSKRQRQVLAGVVRGRSNKVIAWELGLSVRTVEAYRAQLIARLGARNTADAVRLALAAGLGDPEHPDRLG